MNAIQNSPPARTVRWLPLIIALALALATILIRLTFCTPFEANAASNLGWLSPVISSLAFGVLCGLIVGRQPHNRIGWLCGVIAVVPTLFAGPLSAATGCAGARLSMSSGLPYLLWLSNFSSIALTLQFLLLPLWFPDGRFLSAGWRRFAVISFGLMVLSTLLLALWPGRMFMDELNGFGLNLDNPFGLPFRPSPDLTQLVQALYSITWLGGILIAQLSLFARWRRADGPTRQQLKVFAFFLVTIGTVFMLFELIGQLLHPVIDLFNLFGGWLYLALVVLLWAGYPVAIGVSVLKYRMYDVDVVIRKTLVYSVLTALLAAIYFGGVVLFQQVFRGVIGHSTDLAIVVSTLAIAALFFPLRRRVQNAIDRRFYRRKYDAAKTLAAFSATVRDEVELEKLTAELVNVVHETMQPKSVSVWLKQTTDHRWQTSEGKQ